MEVQRQEEGEEDARKDRQTQREEEERAERSTESTIHTVPELLLDIMQVLNLRTDFLFSDVCRRNLKVHVRARP